MLNYDDTKRVTRRREEQFSTGSRSSDDTKCNDRFCPQSDAINFRAEQTVNNGLKHKKGRNCSFRFAYTFVAVEF